MNPGEALCAGGGNLVLQDVSSVRVTALGCGHVVIEVLGDPDNFNDAYIVYARGRDGAPVAIASDEAKK